MTTAVNNRDCVSIWKMHTPQHWLLLLLQVTFYVAVTTTTIVISATTCNTNGLYFAQGFGMPLLSTKRRCLSSSTTAFVSSSLIRGGGSGIKICVSSIGRSALSSSAATTIADDTIDASDKVPPVPSWEDLQLMLENVRSDENKKQDNEKPVLTLYRDTNGWCPFCERVWVAIRAKGLPYQETLVSLQNKPEWYKQMVPSGLVPAVLFHEDYDMNTTRKLVWESKDILYALDEMFPDTPQLMKGNDDTEFSAAMELQDRVQSAGFKFTYGGNNSIQTDDEIQKLRNDFISVLEELNKALGEQEKRSNSNNSEDGNTGGCFRLGKEFSAVDATMIPMMERWRYQLPLTKDFDILQNRIHLQNWFDHLDTYAPYYADRIAGDRYSWTAVTSTFLRFFGGNSTDPEMESKIEHADTVANELTNSFVTSFNNAMKKDDDTERRSLFAVEAARKLITNHEAVTADCCNDEPLSQKHIPRSSCDRDAVDLLLRYVTSMLIEIAADDAVVLLAGCGLSSSLLSSIDSSGVQKGADALRTVATRLCVPRDMGLPAAALLRGVLCTVAESLE